MYLSPIKASTRLSTVLCTDNGTGSLFLLKYDSNVLKVYNGYTNTVPSVVPDSFVVPDSVVVVTSSVFGGSFSIALRSVVIVF
jgi:hypothetical protein